MPTETEIVQLKKEIHHLREYISGLKQENKEQSLRIGELESQLLNNKNRELLLKESQLLQSKDLLRKNVEDVLADEKEKIEEVKKQNAEFQEQIKRLKKVNEDNDLYIKKLQLENNQVKKQLIEFGKKHEATDFINEVRVREDAIRKKESEYQKIVLQWNQLRDQMEEVLSENRVLRQLADVPENYGIDIAKIQMGDRLKIEDYKAKIRILKQEVDDLESERAKLKHRLTYLANAADLNEPPFNGLTPEQKVEVARYAQCLYEGTEFITPERYDLLKEIQNLKTKLELLENQNSQYRIDGIYRITGQVGNNKKDKKDLITELREENAEMKQMLKETLDRLNNGEGMYYQTDSFGQKKGMTTGNMYMKKPSIISATGESITYDEFAFAQLPPIPFVNERNVDSTRYGGSYRFNTKIRIDPNQVHQLFGVALDDSDPDQLKKESAALQTQMIELLEIEARRNNNDDALNANLKNIYNRFEGIVLIQNEIFSRYMKDKKEYKEENDKNTKINNDLISEMNAMRKINKSYEEAIALIEKRNMSSIENKMIEKMKENAILENNNMKLTRQYQCLVEEEKRLREFVENNEEANIEKDKLMKGTIAKLKGWKQMLMYYLKLLNDKLKKSVDRKEFEKVVEENKYLRQKNNELNIKDLNVLKQMAINQSMKMKYKSLENDYYECEEMKLDAQIELNYLKKKIQNIDADYYNEQKAFRKLSTVFSIKNLKQNDIIKTFTNINIDVSSKESILSLLTIDNSIISKADFENAIRTKLNINDTDITPTELKLIYKYLNCDDESNVDIRYMIKKLDQIISEDSENEIKDKELLQQFIDCVRNSGKSLLSTFEFFDTNNNGNITRDEFKFALNQLKFPISDEIIGKLILIVSGEPESKNKLDNTDTFNYIDFCDLFEQKAKSYTLKKKKINQNKNTMTIDWKFNMLSAILTSMERSHMTIEDAFIAIDKTQRGFLTYDEFSMFVHSIGTYISDEDIKKLYKMYDTSNLNLISIDVLKAALNTAKNQITSYQTMTTSTAKTQIDYAKGYFILQEEKKLFNFKTQQMQHRIEELERNNNEMQKQIEKNTTENADKIAKYFDAIEELMKLKEKYVTNGIEKKDLQKLEDDNESLTREVTLLRIGMNTFKELYNSSNQQVKLITLNKEKNTDELDTYKKAIRELQSENNMNALIGKLYYTILISRWREANTLRKYDDFIADFSSLKEDNFQLETQNRTLTKDLTELQVSFHEKVIENVRMADQIENYENGIVIFDTDKNQIHPLEELKQLVKLMTNEKKDMTENIIRLKKSLLKVENDKATLENQIAFCTTLAERIRFDNQDEYSKKLIKMCEEMSDLRLSSNIANREKEYLKDNEAHLTKVNERLDKEIKRYEVENAEWEKKYRKMEEIYHNKDSERQKNLFNALSKLKIYDINELDDVLKGKETKLVSNNPNDKIPNEQYENKIAELVNMLKIKDNEIQRLTKINNDNMAMLQQDNNFYNENSMRNLVKQSGYDLIKDDETKLIAQTAHKTIKTLQDMLSQKNNIIHMKENQIEQLHEENKKMKSAYLMQIGALQDQIKNDHEATLKKLSNIIDTTNSNLVIKMTQNDLSLLTLNDLEKLINDKDNAIRALAIELKAVKEENNKNYILLSEKNRKMAEMQENFGDMERNRQYQGENEQVENMKRILEEKMKMIEREKEKIDQLKMDFAKQYQEKAFNAENAELDKTLGVPDRLILNKEKSELYIKIDKLMKKNRKINDEKKEMQKKIDELEKEKSELIQKSLKTQEQSKKLLQFQKTDTEKISKLRNENEKLKNQLNDYKDNNEKLKNQLNTLQEQKNKESSSTNVLKTKKSSNTIQRKPSIKQQQQPKPNILQSVQDSVNMLSIDKSNVISTSKQPQNLQSSIQRSVDKQQLSYDNKIDSDLLMKLIYFCISKNINMNKQLNKYDLSKSGKITSSDFMKSIDELRLGFIDYDLKQLALIAKPIDDIIVIKNFIAMMKERNDTYKHFLEEEERKELINSNRETTMKYNPFQNKNYNINY